MERGDRGRAPGLAAHPSGVVFRKVPGGTFWMALSDAELDAVRAIERDGGVEDSLASLYAGAGDARPVWQVHVEPFLIARHPLTVAQVRQWLPDYGDDYAANDTGTARFEDGLEELLEAMPFRLPTEAEWEYAAWAGTTTLTFRGDGRPGPDQLLDDFGDEQRTAAAENPFGVAAMGSTNEICADVWIPSFVNAPADARPRIGEGPEPYAAAQPISTHGKGATNGYSCCPPPDMSIPSSRRSVPPLHSHLVDALHQPAPTRSNRSRSAAYDGMGCLTCDQGMQTRSLAPYETHDRQQLAALILAEQRVPRAPSSTLLDRNNHEPTHKSALQQP